MDLIFWVCVAFIGYAYAGYPLLLAVAARLTPRPAAGPAAEPTVTLLIAAHNEQAVIAQKLENSLALDYPRERLQIIVAADGSDDQTVALTRQYAARGVELSFRPERRGKRAAINQAMTRAAGDVVVFSDANNLYAPDALRWLVAPFGAAQVGAVTGAKTILRGDGGLGDSEGLYWKYEGYIKTWESRLGVCTGVAGEILAVRRALYTPPPDGVINDDFYIAMRIVKAGYQVLYAPQARSAERVSASARDERARRARIVAGRYQALALAPGWLPWDRPRVVWQVLSHKFTRPLVPVAMLGALAANLALAVEGPLMWRGLLGLQALFYVLAGLGERLKRWGPLGRLLYLPAFLVNSNLAALMGLARFLTRRQTSVWERARRIE